MRCCEKPTNQERKVIEERREETKIGISDEKSQGFIENKRCIIVCTLVSSFISLLSPFLFPRNTWAVMLPLEGEGRLL